MADSIQDIGFIGTGIMGGHMARRLVEAGYSLTVYTRTRPRAEPLIAAGARWAETPGACARDADLVISIVGYPEDVEAVYFGGSGVLSGLKPKAVCVDMTTSSPDLAVRISEAAAAQGSQALDAPVSGGDIGARDGKLAIMAGGSREAFARAEPVFRVLGPAPRLIGPAGSGQHTKMANQTAIAGAMLGAVEAMLYARRAGLDTDAVLSVLTGGAASSWVLGNLGSRMLAGDLEPGFLLHHFLKDLRIALREARRMGLALPGLSLAEQFYTAARSRGLGMKGHQALFSVLDSLSPTGTESDRVRE